MKKIKKNEWIFLGMVSLILVILVSSYFIIPHLAKGNIPESIGLFGDQFGAVNALFSGLAFAGLIYTILLQKDELEAQREELSLTRQEIKAQRQELEAQNETLALQRFESSFFNMLSQHHNITARQETFKHISHRGINAISSLVGSVYESYQKNEDGLKVSGSDKEKFLYYYTKFSPQFYAYFKSFYHLIYFIDLSVIADKQLYIDTVLSQLSESEIQLLFNHGLLPKENNLRNMIYKYHLLKNLTAGAGDFYKNNRSFYSEKAYE